MLRGDPRRGVPGLRCGDAARVAADRGVRGGSRRRAVVRHLVVLRTGERAVRAAGGVVGGRAVPRRAARPAVYRAGGRGGGCARRCRGPDQAGGVDLRGDVPVRAVAGVAADPRVRAFGRLRRVVHRGVRRAGRGLLPVAVCHVRAMAAEHGRREGPGSPGDRRPPADRGARLLHRYPDRPRHRGCRGDRARAPGVVAPGTADPARPDDTGRAGLRRPATRLDGSVPVRHPDLAVGPARRGARRDAAAQPWSSRGPCGSLGRAGRDPGADGPVVRRQRPGVRERADGADVPDRRPLRCDVQRTPTCSTCATGRC